MISLEFDIIVFKEDKAYVAYSPELDISSCGNSVDHAKDMLKTAVRLFLEEADKMETLEDILEESGYKKNEKRPKRPLDPSQTCCNRISEYFVR